MKRLNPNLRLLPSSLLVLLIACGAPDTRDVQTRTITDSAGIEIVLINPGGASVPRWASSVDPILELGKLSGDESEEFFRVTGAVLLSTGRIVVGSNGTSEIRVFDTEGEILHRFGREGEGPGEFRDISFLGLLPGDTVVVHDGSLLRVSLFHPEIGFLRSQPFPGPGGAPIQIFGGVLNGASLVSWSVMNAPPQIPGVHITSETIGVFDLRTGESTPVATLRTVEEGLGMNRGRLKRTYPPFGRKGDVVSALDHFFVLQSDDDSSIGVFDSSGTLLRIIRIRTPRESTDPQAIAAWIESFVRQTADGSKELAASLRRSFEETPSPDFIPLFRSLEADTDGNVCAERYPHTVDEPPVFWCFSPDGVFVRIISFNSTPRRSLHPFQDAQLEIGEDYILGVWVDDLGMEYVRRYRLNPTS